MWYGRNLCFKIPWAYIYVNLCLLFSNVQTLIKYSGALFRNSWYDSTDHEHAQNAINIMKGLSHPVMMQCNLFWIKSCILTPKYNIRHRHLTDQHLVFKFFCPSVDQSHGFYRDHQIFWPQSSDFKSFEVERFQLIVVNLQDLICSQGLIKKQFITIITCSNRPYLLDVLLSRYIFFRDLLEKNECMSAWICPI